MVTERELTVVEEGRRPGDTAVLVADIAQARRELHWQPRYTLTDMVRHAWAYMN